MSDLVKLIVFFVFIYDTIRFIFIIIYKNIDKKKQKKWVLDNFIMITGNVSNPKYIKVPKGDKIILEYADNKCAFGKIRKTIFSKRVYAPLDMLTDERIFHKGEKVNNIFMYFRLCCYILLALGLILNWFII